MVLSPFSAKRILELQSMSTQELKGLLIEEYRKFTKKSNNNYAGRLELEHLQHKIEIIEEVLDHKQNAEQKAIEIAKNLVGEGENPEYTRGICEFLADYLQIPNVEGMEHSEVASIVCENFLEIHKSKIYPQ